MLAMQMAMLRFSAQLAGALPSTSLPSDISTAAHSTKVMPVRL
jgi:hypothetical protein